MRQISTIALCTNVLKFYYSYAFGFWRWAITENNLEVSITYMQIEV